MNLKMRLLYLASIILVLSGADGLMAQSPSLASSTFYGGAGDQTGRAVTITGGNIYIGGQNGEMVRYAIPPTSPTASSAVSGTNIYGMASTLATVYPVGQAYPSSCGASDGVGDTESKAMFSRYDAASGGLISCQSANFFPYRGSEGYFAAANGGSSVFSVGFGETCGFGHANFVLSKYDLSGTLLSKVSEPGVDFGGFTCIGFSLASAVALLNGNVYVAGQSKLSTEDGVYRPALMRYSAALTRDWKARPTDNSGGAFNGVTTLGSAIYAAGFVGVSPNYDYLIEKYDESGARLWSKVSGGAGQDVLTAITPVGSRLFAVGYTTSQGAGGMDAVLLEIDPSTGNTLSTTAFGGALDDVANAVTTDGVDLYVAGVSNSFGYGGNAVGQRDIMLLRYTLAPSYSVCLLYDPTKAVKAGATIPIKLQLCSASGADLSSSSIVVHAINVTQTSSSISGPVEDSGNANPDNDFRYDFTLGSTGGYIYNLSTKGLTTGTYTLNFKVGTDATIYQAPFQVK